MEDEIHKLQSSYDDAAIGYRNLMEIFLSANVSEKEIFIKGKLSRKNLTGLVFNNLNLTSFDFRHSLLNEVRFNNCNLTNAHFDGSHFKNTFFSSDCLLEGATTKGAITDIIRTDTKTLDDKKSIDSYFYEKTKTRIDQNIPCQAVINLRKLLEKIVKKGCGHNMPKQFLLRTKCSGGGSCR